MRKHRLTQIFLRNTFLTQIHADCTQIYAGICDHLRLICDHLRLKYFFKALTQIMILAACYSLLVTCCHAQPISSKELIERAKEYDGKIVEFQGEAVGDIMRRGHFAWININDGQNALGVWLKKDLAEKIDYLGSYKFTGDMVLTQGKFNRACLEHGGDLDIHASSLMIIKSGSPVEEKISVQKYKAAIGFLGVVLCFGILRRLKRKPGKK